MTYDFNEILTLFCSGKDHFYDHFKFENNIHFSEVYYTENHWKYRNIINNGEWIFVNSPLDIPGLDANLLKSKLIESILVQYSYYLLIEDDPFRRKRIEKILGIDICSKGHKSMLEFLDTMKKAISENVKNELKILE